MEDLSEDSSVGDSQTQFLDEPMAQNFGLECSEFFECIDLSSLEGNMDDSDTHGGTQSIVISDESVNNNNDNNDSTEVLPEGVQGSAVPIVTTRVQLVQFALTFPQCEMPPSVAMGNIVAHFKKLAVSISYCVVAREPHKDGKHHLHVGLKLTGKLRYTDVGGIYWDFVANQHGNYQRMKWPTAWIGYCIKGGCYVSSPGFDPVIFCSATSKKRSYVSEAVAKEIIQGDKDIGQLCQEYPGFMIMQLRKVEQFEQFMIQERQKKRKLLELPLLLGGSFTIYSEQTQQIYEWFLTISQGKFTHKVKHLRIEGPTAIGKTSLIAAIGRYFRIYSMPLDEDFYCAFKDDAYDIVVFDEYRADKTLTFLNRFCDGSYHPLKRKGISTYLHTRRIPCIMLTNYSWENAYTKAKDSNSFPATIRRWDVVLYDEHADLLNLVADLTPDPSTD